MTKPKTDRREGDRRFITMVPTTVPHPEQATRVELHLRAALSACAEDTMPDRVKGEIELGIWTVLAALGCPDALFTMASKFQADTDDGDVRCNRGHVTMHTLWNCPACTDAILDAVRRGMLEEAKSISDEIDKTVDGQGTSWGPGPESSGDPG